LGSIVGAELDEIPANRRFYAGGGGSVRGYRYRTLGPTFLGEPIGGRSLLEASLEARIKITNTIGIVPFVDAGTAFESSFPDFDEDIRVAAGLGLRYYTSIGPIRLDVAIPVNPGPGDPSYAIYVGIGQAF
jgi:translocation and assembly module TamA